MFQNYMTIIYPPLNSPLHIFSFLEITLYNEVVMC